MSTRSFSTLSLWLLIPAMFTSCVNEDYDLTKDIDKTFIIDGEISAPIGNSETISVLDLFDLDSDESGTLALDLNDNYILTFFGKRTETSFSVPSFSITDELVTLGGNKAYLKRSDIIAEIFHGEPASGLPIPSGIELTRMIGASSTPIKIDQEVPEEIIDIKDVTGSALAKVSFHSNIGKATIRNLAIDFPDYLEISDILSGGMEYSFDRKGNILKLGQVELSPEIHEIKLMITGLDFSKFPYGQGFNAFEHKVLLDNSIELSGFELKMLSDDFGKTFSDIPEEIFADVSITITALNIQDVTVKVNPKIEVTPKVAKVGTLPDFISGEGAVVDLYNPQVMLIVGNDSPLAMTLDADLESYKGSSKRSVHIGANGAPATDEIKIESDAVTRIFLSRTGGNVPDNYLNIKVPNLSDVVKDVPEEMALTNIETKAEDEFITVRGDQTYTFYCNYTIIAPLSFGSDLRIEYDSDFDGWGEMFNPKDDDVQLEVRGAEVTFDFVNMIPLGIGLEASAIDKDGKIIPGIKVNVDGDVASGSVEKPAKSPMKISLTATEQEMRKLDGLRMHLRISGPDKDHLGVCLNRGQGIKFENMKVKLQGTITSEL